MALILLAGGKSSRMGGGDKSQLQLGSMTMVEQSIVRFRRLFSQIIVVAKEGEQYSKLPKVQVVNDRYPGCGPISGIHAGLLASEDWHNLILACDLPLVKEEMVDFLLERASQHKKVVTVPELGDRLEPLVGVYVKGLIKVFEEAILAGNYSLQKVLRNLELDVVTECEIRKIDPQLESFINVNTPEDYQWVRKKFTGEI